MGTVLEQDAQPRAVEVELNYCGKMDVKPTLPMRARQEGDSDADRALRALNIQPRRVLIRDGSSAPVETNLDREGFVLLHHPSKVKNFQDVTEIKEVHHEEIRSLLKSLTGADIVEFPYNTGGYRSSVQGFANGPVSLPHIDFSKKGASETVSRLVSAKSRHVRRWGIYQVWRALSPVAPVDAPLAVLDAQSVSPDDYLPLDTKSESHVGEYEFIVMHYNPNHRWMYFSQMKRDDIIVFKAYDSDASKNRPTAHTGFSDPSAPPDAAPRSSFELRAYVGWSA